MSQKLKAQQQQMQESRQIQSAVALQAQLQDVKNIPHVAKSGNKVMVTEFFDYQCYYCHHMAPVIEKLMKNNPNVTFVFRDWPIFASRWENSSVAAVTGLQVWKQQGAKAYINYHNGIFATGHDEGKLTKKDIHQAANHALKGKLAKFSSKEYQGVIMKNAKIAQTIGFQGTPGFIIMPVKGASVNNTTVVGGAAPLSTIQQAIKKAAQ